MRIGGSGIYFFALFTMAGTNVLKRAINGLLKAEFGTHVLYLEIKANFCGRKKEGHFHYKNFLRALK